MLALLPQVALVESSHDPTLAVRDLASVNANGAVNTLPLTREVVMVTTQDRLLIPPIANFRRLVQDFFKTQVRSQVDPALSLSQG